MLYIEARRQYILNDSRDKGETKNGNKLQKH